MSRTKTIYFIRHGQSEANARDLFQGPDAPLTELGHKQARFVAERVKRLDAEVIIASPMPRAQETACVIHEATEISLETNELVREYVPPSELVGLERISPEGQAYTHEMMVHMGDPSWHFSDEENYYDLHIRAIEALAYLEGRPEAKLLVLTHAGFLRVLVTAMMTDGEPDPLTARRLMRFLKPMYTGITVCAFYPQAVRRCKWRLIAWNDHAHLAETEMKEPR